MKTTNTLAILVATFLFQGCSSFVIDNFTDYTIMGETMSQREACGDSGCVPTTKRRALHYNRKVGSIEVADQNASVKSIALQYIGRLIHLDDSEHERCGLKNSFKPEDIVHVNTNSSGYKVGRKIKGRFEINADLVAKLTIADILKVAQDKGIQIGVDNDLDVKLKAIFNSLDKVDYELSATTYFLKLKDDIRDDFKDGTVEQRLLPCLKEMREKKSKRKFIDAMTMVEYSLRDSSHFIDNALFEMKALFSSNGINFDIAPYVKSNLTKNITKEIDSAYAVLVIERSFLSRYLD